MNDKLSTHWARVVESADDAIISKTLDGRITSWNAAAKRLFGYEAREMLGRSIMTLIPDELQHEEAEIIGRIRAGSRVSHYETIRCTKDGRRIPISISVSPIRDADGVIVGAAKIARDISVQKQVEAALQDEAKALDTLNQLAQVVSAELNLERLVQVATDAARELSGAAFGAFFYNQRGGSGDGYVLYALSGASRESFASFPLPRNTALFGSTFRGEGTVRSGDITQDPRYGKNTPFAGMPEGHLPVRSYLAVPVVSRLGEVLGGLFLGHPEPGVFRERAERLVQGIAAQAAIGIDNARLYQSAQKEIAERRRAEAALRRSEQVYRAIGESIDYGIWVCDPSGRNVYASESFLRLVGMTQQECFEYGWSKALHPEEREPTLERWKECVRSGSLWDIEHRYLGVDGNYHPVLARGVPVRDDTGAVSCWAGINLDITRLKRAEETLREADRRKDEFLAILAHELRNPLAPIRYALALGKESAADESQRHRASAIIERQVEHVSRLLEDLLDVARISHGRLELAKGPVDLGSTLRSAMEVATPLLEARRHAVQVSIAEQPISLEADTVRISQVFANLLINAAKYTEPGGRVELSAYREGAQAVVVVRDSGIGISPEAQQRLFTLFFRSESPMERSAGGLGVGLALAQSIVQLHGGTIEARSDGVGKGSEFTVRLPTASSYVVNGSRVESKAQGDPLRLLVADDSEDGLELCSELLRLWGHEVLAARSGREALQLCERYRPQVALLDIGMPDMSGYEVARELRKKKLPEGMVLVALTGWGRAEDKQAASDAGFDHHLTKPVNPSTLARLLARLGPGVVALP